MVAAVFAWEHGVGDIFREVDEELRQERFEKLFKRYGWYVVGAILLVILGVGGYQQWQHHVRSQREAESARFAAALRAEAEGKSADAQALFSALGQESSSGYGTLARLHEAALRAKDGDREGAINVYEAIAADEAVDRPLRDLATILAALQRLGDPNADLAAMKSRIEPLAAKSAAWRYSAMEILALIAQKEGRTEDAKKTYHEIADDPDAPQGARARAAQVLAVLEG